MNKHFAKKIKELRKENNLTQDETNYIYISSQKLLANQELNKQSIRKAFKQQMNDDIEKELFESGDFQKDDEGKLIYQYLTI
ncbi:MAG: hypothetical protein WAO49_07125 [Arcanobacterium sp.]